MKLRYLLILIFFALAMTPVLLFRTWPHSAVLDGELEEVHQRHLLLARNLAEALEHYHHDVVVTFKLLASERNQTPELTNILENLSFRRICIADRLTGRVTGHVSLPNAPCPEVVPEALLRRMDAIAVSDEVAFDEVVAAADGENVIHLAMRLDAQKLAIGSIRTGYFRKLGESIAFGVKGHAEIVDQRGNVLSHPLRSWVAGRRNIAKTPVVQRLMRGETGVERFYSLGFEADMIAGFASVAPVGWGVMIPQPVQELQAKAIAARQSTYYVLMIGVAGAVLLALLVSVLASRPLEEIARAARRVSRGDLDLPDAARPRRFLPQEFRELQSSFRDMLVQLRESRTKISTLAFVDGVTGLANREYLRRRIESFLDQAEPRERATLLFLDLDGFKAVNDTKGHDVGDVVLNKLGQRLCGLLAEPPLVEQHPDENSIPLLRSQPTIARLGGDEFALFLPDIGEEAAMAVADTILDELETPFRIGDSDVLLGVSVGISRIPEDAREYSSLLKAADVAMYEAKRSGKNQVRLFSPEIQNRPRTRHDLADDLFSSRIRDQLEMYYQPIYRMSDMALTGVEGLVRWHHPSEGLLEPDAFLDVAADLGLQRRIDQMVLDQSVRTLTNLAGRGTDMPALSINLSVERLISRPFVDRLVALMPLPFELSIELTKTTLLDALDARITWSADRLSEAGIGLELDDFGSTHASIAALLDLSPRRIKLGSDLIQRIAEGHPIFDIIMSITEMAHSLDIEVVAKGVENLNHVRLLRELGCDYAQGFALNSPMTKEELAVHLHRVLASGTGA